MGDCIKLAKDKRHRSSSSLAGAMLEGTRSERKLDINASIEEVDDQFAIADVRCDDLQDKIDLIKSLKRKKKLKKRSMTKVIDQSIPPDNGPLIAIRTHPKKTLLITEVSQQAARMRRLEVPPNPTRSYLDPAMVEQHRMIGQVRGYNNNNFKHSQDRTQHSVTDKSHHTFKVRPVRQHQAEGDNRSGHGNQMIIDEPLEMICAEDELTNYSPFNQYQDFDNSPEEMQDPRPIKMHGSGRRRHVPREVPTKDVCSEEGGEPWRSMPQGTVLPRQHKVNKSSSGTGTGIEHQIVEERPVVELFNKSYGTVGMDDRKTESQTTRKTRKVRPSNRGDKMERNERLEDRSMTYEQSKKSQEPKPRKVKYRSRRYELPTVASQMKQAGMRYYYGPSNHTNIPFVVSKSTAPSHNIGVNIQQVLNGIKMQQPLSGIPLTIAHHMGLGHVPSYSAKTDTMEQPALEHREINAIKVGQRLLRLPSYNKYMSYNRLLTMYREGDGMVPRFLRAISRPHYFYTSMYNLATHEDFDGATSKGRATSQEAKQNLAEFAHLYREYENINKCIKEGQADPDLEQRRSELSKELAAREQTIRRVMQDYRSSPDIEQNLRCSASTAEEGYRHSTYKIGDSLQ